MAKPSDSPPSHRRRFLLGLALAGLFAGLCGLGLLHRTELGEAASRSERLAGVTFGALTDLVKAARGAGPPEATEVPSDATGIGAELGEVTGEPSSGIGAELDALDAPAAVPAEDAGGKLRAAVAAFAAAHPEVVAIRVVTFEGIQLDASTAPGDTGDNAAPRKLAREEKDLFDLGQKLRAAVQSNQETGNDAGARAEEIAIERRPGGALSLAGPVEVDGDVVGMVQMETTPKLPEARHAWLPALSAAFAPVLALFLLALGIRERRLLLAATSAILLLAALWGFAGFADQSLTAAKRTTAEAMAAQIRTERASAESVATRLGTPVSAWNVAAWDTDAYRKPRGLIDTQGAIDEAKLSEESAGIAGRTKRALAVVGLLALVLLGFVGFGGAATMVENLVEHRVAYAYTLPAMIGMVFLVFLPFLYGVMLSFTNANIYNSNKPIFDIWNGLANFGDILGDFHVFQRTADGLVFDYHNFYWTLGFTVVWTIANVSIGVTLGLLLALVLNTKGLAFRPFYRVILILPWAMPNYITALIWKGMFHPQFGVINQILQIFGGSAIAWFDKPLTSFAAVVTTNGWLSFPFMMVISLGALQSISADLYEAARVDGASRWQQFKSITLPSIKPALVPAVILSVIWTFNMFNIIYLVSGGEPGGATEILVTQAYKLAFEQYRYGYAAAYSVVIFLILLGYGTWQNRVTQATEGV
ncbi:MAG TPA: ABC transporter permease subunit [Thermoanaerobaculia bacterium]|nr:ABC transporter permease subunit [Thermoanaerobaculia bacterium]